MPVRPSQTPKAGQMRHRVAISRKKDLADATLDAGGNPTGTGNELIVGHRYAEIVSGRGMEYEIGSQPHDETTHVIKLRNDSLTRKINPTYWFIHNNVRYNIVSAPDEGFTDRLICRFECRTIDGRA